MALVEAKTKKAGKISSLSEKNTELLGDPIEELACPLATQCNSRVAVAVEQSGRTGLASPIALADLGVAGRRSWIVDAHPRLSVASTADFVAGVYRIEWVSSSGRGIPSGEQSHWAGIRMYGVWWRAESGSQADGRWPMAGRIERAFHIAGERQGSILSADADYLLGPAAK